MADNLTLKGRVEIDSGPAANSMQVLGARFNKLALNANTYTKTLKAQSQVMNTLAAAQVKEAAALGKIAEAQAKVNKTNQEAKAIQAKASQTRGATKNAKMDAEGRAALAISKQQTEVVRQRVLLEEQAGRNAERGARMALAADRERLRVARQQQAAIDAQYAGLASMRYALYDVAQTAAVFAAALGAAAIVPTTIAVQWERAFADVERTVGGTENQVGALRDQFVDLAQTIPATWADLTDIGTLAGQLGIARDNVAGFTEVVAKFSATTDVGVNDAATAFGRINSLIPDVKGDFEGVGDAISKVGVNSVATESQIVRIVTQISALGSQANFGYHEIIGLAGALASVGVPPELARGTITRVFGELSRAISSGGVKLESFSRLAGMSGREFKTAWSEDSAGTFLKFMRGIQQEGSGAEAAIRDLGITSVRDVPILIRLANAADSAGNAGGLLAQTFQDAANSGGAMGEQYSVIVETISSKIQILINSIQALMDAAGQQNLEFLGDGLDYITNHLKNLTDFAETDAGAAIIQFGVILGGLLAIIALVTAAIATGYAGMAALITATRGLQAAAGGATLTMGRMNTLLAQTGPLGKAAAVGIKVLTTSMKLLSLVGLVLVLPDVLKWATDGINAVTGFEATYNAAFERMNKVQARGPMNSAAFDKTMLEIVSKSDDAALAVGRAFANINLGGGGWATDLKLIDDGLKELAEGGNLENVAQQLDRLSDRNNLSIEELLRLMPELNGYLEGQGIRAYEAVDGMVKLRDATGEHIAVVEQLTEAEIAAEESYTDSIAGYDEALRTFFDIGAIYESMIAANKKLAQDTADKTKDASDSWQDYFDTFDINLSEYVTSLEEQAKAQDKFTENLLTLKMRGGSDEAIEELRKLGVEGAPLVQAFVDDTTGEFERFQQAVNDGVGDGVTDAASALADATPAFFEAISGLSAETQAQIIQDIAAGKESVQSILDKLRSEEADKPIHLTADGDAARREGESLTTYYNRMRGYFMHNPLQIDGDYGDAYDGDAAFRLWLANQNHEIFVKYRVDQYSLNAARRAAGNTALLEKDGGVVNYYAGGGFNERHVAQIASGNTARVWSEPETKGEAYIPLAIGKRERSINIWEETGRRLGVYQFAEGGMMGPNLSSYASNSVTNYYGGSGGGTGVIELSPTDRMLLRRAGNLELRLGDRVVARAVNNHNVRENNRGAY